MMVRLKKMIGFMCMAAMLLFLTACASSDKKQDTDRKSDASEATVPREEADKNGDTNPGTEEPKEQTREQSVNTIADTESETDNEKNRVLVAYFSATGTTKKLAEYAADVMGADLYEIVPEEPYTDADLAYYTGGRADREQDDPDVRPAISGSVENIGDYDIIILGYPIWHGQAPRIISTFLESYDFSQKTIVPFCTSHSSGVGSSADDLHSLCADSTEWKEGKRFGGETEKGLIEEWLTVLL